MLVGYCLTLLALCAPLGSGRAAPERQLLAKGPFARAATKAQMLATLTAGGGKARVQATSTAEVRRRSRTAIGFCSTSALFCSVCAARQDKTQAFWRDVPAVSTIGQPSAHY